MTVATLLIAATVLVLLGACLLLALARALDRRYGEPSAEHQEHRANSDLGYPGR